MSHSQKSLQDTSNEVRSSILFAELSRLEKELKEQGAQKVMQRETTRDRLKRLNNNLATQQSEDEQDPGVNSRGSKMNSRGSKGKVNQQSPGPNEPLQVIGWRPTNPNIVEFKK